MPEYLASIRNPARRLKDHVLTFSAADEQEAVEIAQRMTDTVERREVLQHVAQIVWSAAPVRELDFTNLGGSPPLEGTKV